MNYPEPINTQIIANSISLSSFKKQDDERSRIAKELHDGIGCLLSTTILLFDTIEPINKQRYEEVRGLLTETQKELRRIVFDLMPATLEKLGLEPAIHQLCELLNRTGFFELKLTIHQANPILCTNEIKVHVYRIIQELLNNVVKHAKASVVELELFSTNEEIKILVKDNGIGWKDSQLSIGKRIKSIGGVLTIKALEKGSSVFVTIPNMKPIL